jgi:fatty acid desaturase
LSAYFAGVIVGIFFMTYTFWVALTFWGGWHLIGGVVTLAVTVPIIVSLEKAGVRKFRNG